MTNAVYGMLPRLITGRTDGISRMLSEIKDWSEKQINEEFDKVPERYADLYGDTLSIFGALNLFTELIKFLREQNSPLYSVIIAEAQKRVLQYHNSQIKNDSSNNS